MIDEDAETFSDCHAVVVFFAALLGTIGDRKHPILPFNGNIYYGILVFNLMLFWSLEHERRGGDFR